MLSKLPSQHKKEENDKKKKLKLKADIVNFISEVNQIQKQQKSDDGTAPEEQSQPPASEIQEKQQKSKNSDTNTDRIKMQSMHPLLRDDRRMQQNKNDNNHYAEERPKASKNTYRRLRDQEQEVLKQYPPLQKQRDFDQQSANDTDGDLLPLPTFSSHLHPLDAFNLSMNGIDDIRQQYHPIIVHHSQKLSDTEVSMVVTASCAPSMTLGVSCTAIRFGKSIRDKGQQNKEAAEKKEKKKAAANHKRFLSEYSTRDLASQQI